MVLKADRDIVLIFPDDFAEGSRQPLRGAWGSSLVCLYGPPTPRESRAAPPKMTGHVRGDHRWMVRDFRGLCLWLCRAEGEFCIIQLSWRTGNDSDFHKWFWKHCWRVYFGFHNVSRLCHQPNHISRPAVNCRKIAIAQVIAGCPILPNLADIVLALLMRLQWAIGECDLSRQIHL